jgi:PIN domain nuclease of toxin-antitoxin system
MNYRWTEIPMAIIDAHKLGAPQQLLLDSAVWIAATTSATGVVAPELLLILEQAAHEGRLYVSTATVWELALLAQRGAINFGDFPIWLADQTRPPGVTLIPITGELAYESTTLPGWTVPTGTAQAGVVGVHSAAVGSVTSSEAIDRFLVSTARRIGAVVVTTDPAILTYAASGPLNAYDARP